MRSGFQTNFEGTGSFAPGGITSTYYIPLPALGAGESISSATFSIGEMPDSSTGAVTPVFNTDLYILGFIASGTPAKDATEAQNFFYLGDTAQTALATPIGGTVTRAVDNFFVPGDFIPSTGSPGTPKTANFTAYINNLYANQGSNGLVPGTSVLVVRLNPDTASPPATGTNRYEFPSLNGATTGDNTNRAQINFVTVPEPTSLALLALGGAAATIRRRRSI
jgi:hypothetical protein